MIVSHSHRYIFIKSNKTAGTSVEAALSKYCDGDDIVTSLEDHWFNRDERGQWVHSAMNAEGFFQHDPATEVRRKVGSEIWSSYFKFSITRNPWDRVVSLYSWDARNRKDLRPTKRAHHRVGFPFNEFRETARIFRRFVGGDWRTNDRFYVDEGGDGLCVDFVIRYECLAEDLAEVCRRIGLPAVELPRLKSGMRESGHGYSEYYDPQSRAIVAERHHNDIRLFGYKFDSAI